MLSSTDFRYIIHVNRMNFLVLRWAKGNYSLNALIN